MASDEYEFEQEDDVAYEDDSVSLQEEDQEQDDDRDSLVAAAPAWIISIIVHALICLVLAGIYFGSMIEEEEPPIRLSHIEAPAEDEEELEEKVELEEVEVTIVDDVESEQPIVTDLDIPVEEIETEDPVEEEAVDPKGREEATSTSEAGGAMAFMAIGAGGGAAGAFGSRSGGGKKQAVGRNGGSQASESAVNAALMWFKKHQSENGMWDVDGYMDNCQEQPKCEPGTGSKAHNADGDSACTAYALLCFLGAGYDHKTPGRFRDTVKKGLKWLIGIQNKDGTFGTKGRNYENAICAMALCEVYAMTMDVTIKEPAQRAIDLLLSRQAESDAFAYGAGWDYKKANPQRNDASVTGWCIMALKAAKSGGIDVGNGWEGSKQWLEAHWKASNPNANPDEMGTGDKSYFAYVYDQTNQDVRFDHKSKGELMRGNFDAATVKRRPVECVGALCAIFLGKRPGDGMIDSLIETITDEQTPKGYPTNTYWMYYNTLAVFQYGGGKWKKWNAEVRDMLVHAQHGRDSGCFNGSWDFEKTGGKLGAHVEGVGRLLSTAYCTLSLEVYYRYERIKKKR